MRWAAGAAGDWAGHELGGAGLPVEPPQQSSRLLCLRIL